MKIFIITLTSSAVPVENGKYKQFVYICTQYSNTVMYLYMYIHTCTIDL